MKNSFQLFAFSQKTLPTSTRMLYAQFHEMCAKVGVDPLVLNKGFWAELLGIGDFYYELGWYQSTSWLLFLNFRFCLYCHHCKAGSSDIYNYHEFEIYMKTHLKLLEIELTSSLVFWKVFSHWFFLTYD